MEDKENWNNPGIYFLLDDNEIIYIGQSIRPESRIKEHFKRGDKLFDSYFVINCDKNEMTDLENKYIIEHLPKFNKKFSTTSSNFIYITTLTEEIKNKLCLLSVQFIILNNKVYINSNEIAEIIINEKVGNIKKEIKQNKLILCLDEDGTYYKADEEYLHNILIKE